MAPQREWFEKDYYRVLGVPETATQKRHHEGVSEAGAPEPSRRQARRQGSRGALQGDLRGLRRRRRRGQAQGVRRGPQAWARWAASFGGGPGGPRGGLVHVQHAATPARRPARRPVRRRPLASGAVAAAASRGAGPQRGQDLEAELNLSFDDAVHGITTTLHLTSDAACSTCHGIGRQAGHHHRACVPICGGRGVIDDNQGFFSFSHAVHQLPRQGVVIDDPCPTCRGTGIERRPRGGEGPHPGRRRRRPAHPTEGPRRARSQRRSRRRPLRDVSRPAPSAVRREGDNLVVRVPSPSPRPCSAPTSRCPRSTAARSRVRLRPARSPATKYRVKGHGIATKKATGDLIVIVDVAVPDRLSDDERAAIEVSCAGLEPPRRVTTWRA